MSSGFAGLSESSSAETVGAGGAGTEAAGSGDARGQCGVRNWKGDVGTGEVDRRSER